MKFRTISLTIALVALGGLMAACGDTGTNTNTSRSNVTNLGTNNANTAAIVVNSNANTNMSSNRWTNANSVTREDYNKNRADYERDKGSSTIGSGANDSWLWFKTRAAMMTTADLRESTVDVDVVNDVVTLKGSVETAAQKAKAEQVAKAIDGVKSVKNELKVAPNDSMTNMSGNSSNGNTNRR